MREAMMVTTLGGGQKGVHRPRGLVSLVAGITGFVLGDHHVI